MKTTKLKKNLQFESSSTIKTPALPLSREEISRRAHEIYLSRGAISGRELDDWLMAERELKQERSKE
jgi:Protein of unknown function (DUF2934)